MFQYGAKSWSDQSRKPLVVIKQIVLMKASGRRAAREAGGTAQTTPPKTGKAWWIKSTRPNRVNLACERIRSSRKHAHHLRRHRHHQLHHQQRGRQERNQQKGCRRSYRSIHHQTQRQDRFRYWLHHFLPG